MKRKRRRDSVSRRRRPGLKRVCSEKSISGAIENESLPLHELFLLSLYLQLSRPRCWTQARLHCILMTHLEPTLIHRPRGRLGASNNLSLMKWRSRPSHRPARKASLLVSRPWSMKSRLTKDVTMRNACPRTLGKSLFPFLPRLAYQRRVRKQGISRTNKHLHPLKQHGPRTLRILDLQVEIFTLAIPKRLRW